MRLHIVAIGARLPQWMNAGYDEYVKRMPRECRVELHAINPPKVSRNADQRVVQARESALLLEKVPVGALPVALDERGKAWSTRDLSTHLKGWLGGGRDVALLIGGANGLDEHIRAKAQLVWSLSSLTLPHGLARVVVAEQLYRAWTLLSGHPYHRD
ncbi:MAG: 23S rRNA (pseudouridine(1915)-N(3))-methyltransferase RlmH [Chromatiales bacterium]|jgi:23S rRNA (pseudouridine1915-N3)-methyltransferase|nr:23S rRNA (pseudouridine(1915)-N(3))-methyltransferase RlmH [Chromatiales bacterium]